MIEIMYIYDEASGKHKSIKKEMKNAHSSPQRPLPRCDRSLSGIYKRTCTHGNVED